MGLYKRPDSELWQYKFKAKGVTYRGSTGTKLKGDAVKVEAAARAAVEAPPKALRPEVTLGQAADGWLADEGLRMQDAANNESRVRKLFGEAKGPRGIEVGQRAGLSRALRVQDLTNELLTNLVRSRRSEGNSDATINREIALVQAVLRYADVKLRARMPDEPVQFSAFTTREKRGKLRWYSVEEEARLLAELERRRDEAVLRNLPPRVQRATQDQLDLALFLLDTGGRYGEGAGVPWDVVDLEAGTVNLYRDKVGNEGLLRLTDRCRVMLRRRAAARDPECPYIFGGYAGRATEARGYAVKGIRKAMEVVGLNAAHLVARFGRATPAHTFRHTFASRLAQAGVSLQKIAHLLGHASVKTTEIYAHLCPSSAADEAVAVLNKIHEPRPVAEVVPLRARG